MIPSSFIFIPGIGKKTEEHLWKSGILTWDDLEKAHIPALNRTKRRIIEDYIELGRESLRRQKASFLLSIYPKGNIGGYIKIFVIKLYFLISKLRVYHCIMML